MKNKHLVFLFLLTLLIGLAVRRAPWRTSTFFQTNLLRLDTAAVQQIQITLPGQSPLFLLRGDAGWSAEQESRSVKMQPELAKKMLLALADLRSIRIAKTTRPDTLGFTAGTAIHLNILLANNQQESLTLGWETVEHSQPGTYVQLPKHDGIYLVNNHLRNIFFKHLTDIRNRNLFQVSPSELRGFTLVGPSLDSLVFQKNDSTTLWTNPFKGTTCTDEQVQRWLSKVVSLRGLPFADLFDESHADDTFYAQINLEFNAPKDPLTLKIFHMHPIHVPEEMPVQRPDRRQLAPFAIHSSQNPLNYFALSDTALLRQICHPL